MKSFNLRLKRLERLFQIRETYVTVAEAGVKQAAHDVRKIETADNEIAGNIQHTQAQIAYLQTATAQDLQSGEKYIQALRKQRLILRHSLEKATSNLEQRRLEWVEAMRQQRIIERMQERRLQEWVREDATANQKTQDDTSIGRYIRLKNTK
jgi:flagellar export protein FliJ